MKICINEIFCSDLHGEPPSHLKTQLQSCFLIIDSYTNLRDAITECKIYNGLCQRQFSVDIVQDYMLEGYSLCIRKTFWLSIFQRRWKTIYHRWKGSLVRALIRAQANQGSWPPPILRTKRRK